jgi:hypothetical protein
LYFSLKRAPNIALDSDYKAEIYAYNVWERGPDTQQKKNKIEKEKEREKRK